jgi:Uma2 family endonuclease
MIAAGIYTERDRLTLIEGRLVRKMTKGRRHSRGSENCRHAIERALVPGWHLEIEKPVRLLTRDTLFEPDMFVARGVADDYEDLDPGPPDVALVVEVSDSSLAEDRAMADTYLGGGIPIYWLVNVADRQLEVYRDDPTTPTIIGEDGHVDLVLDGQVVARIAVADLLPRKA